MNTATATRFHSGTHIRISQRLLTSKDTTFLRLFGLTGLPRVRNTKDLYHRNYSQRREVENECEENMY